MGVVLRPPQHTIVSPETHAVLDIYEVVYYLFFK